ncbi:MAG: type II secretion system F family protein [Candidatus Pacebacteria bacterium]|nr:type II secretion system F family protein [Candidatus Paceibacterota bacterium]
MPIFKFTAKNLNGSSLNGAREAEDKFDLGRKLKAEGYMLVECSEEKTGRKAASFFSGILGGVPLEEKMIFTRNLAVMISAGLPLARALKVLTKQAKSKKFKDALSDISDMLSKGKPLHESLDKYPKIFSHLYVAMVKAGERSGKIDGALKLVAQQLENDFILKRKVRGAMIYPAILVCAMVAIGILMLIYVVPTLVSTFDELGVDLPASTQVIVWLSNSLISNSFVILVFAVILFLAAVWLLRMPAVKKGIDFSFLYLPIISPLVRKINSARFARTLSSLISSGVDILEAFDMTAGVTQNFYYKKIIASAKQEIQKGSSISAPFKQADNVFPPLIGEMISVGEETGKLSEMLLQIAEFYEGEVSEATKDLATVIEPVLMVIIGAVVGFFAISMIKPMYSMMGGV